jgi:hypothetical protein
MSAAIAGWLVSGVAGVALLAGGCWWASTRTWRTHSTDVAPGADVPESLYQMQQRRDRR